MKCILCEKYSYDIICNKCQEDFLKPNLFRAKIGDVDVVSFYKYDDIKELIHLKYTNIGSSVFKILAKNSITKFIQNFDYNNKIYAISIDNASINKNYSHTAILAKASKSKTITPLYDILKSSNNIKYANKKLDWKLKNPRNFIYTGKSNIDAVLIDDIVTDGVTINEAKQTLSKYNVNILFALALSSAYTNSKVNHTNYDKAL